MLRCLVFAFLPATPEASAPVRVELTNSTGQPARRSLQTTCTSFSEFSEMQQQITTACCATQACASGFPEVCQPGDCTSALTLMSTTCRDFMTGGVYSSLLPLLDAATATCASPPPPPAAACNDMTDFNAGLDRVNTACCPDGCPTGLPTDCSAACGAVLLPFRDGCRDFFAQGVGQSMSPLIDQAADRCQPLVPPGGWVSTGPCDPNPCRNGGVCTDFGSGHRRSLGEGPDTGGTCACATGFTGVSCADASPSPPPAYCTARIPSLPDFISSILNTESAGTFAAASAYFVDHMSEFDWSITIPTEQCDVPQTLCSTLSQSECGASNGNCGWCDCDSSGNGYIMDGDYYVGSCYCSYDSQHDGVWTPSCWGVIDGGDSEGGYVDAYAGFCAGTTSWHDEPLIIYDGDDENNGLWKEALADISDGLTQIAEGLHPEPDGVESPMSPIDLYTWLGDALGDVTYSGTGDWHTFGSRCYDTFDALDQIDMDHVAAIAEGEDFQEGDETETEFGDGHAAFDVLKQVCAMVRDGFEDTTTTKPLDSLSDDCKLSMSNILDFLIAFFDIPSMRLSMIKLASELEALGSIVWTLRVDGKTYVERDVSDGFTLVMQRMADVLNYVAQEGLPQDGSPDRPVAVLDVWRFLLDLLDMDVAQAGHKLRQITEAIQGVDFGRDVATPVTPCDDGQSCDLKEAGDNYDRVCTADDSGYSSDSGFYDPLSEDAAPCMFEQYSETCSRYSTSQNFCETQSGCMWVPSVTDAVNGDYGDPYHPGYTPYPYFLDPQTQCMFDYIHRLPGDSGDYSPYEGQLLTPGCAGKWMFSVANPCLTLSMPCSTPHKILNPADLTNPDEYDKYDNWLSGWKGTTNRSDVGKSRYCIWNSDYTECAPIDLSYCNTVNLARNHGIPDYQAWCSADPSYCPGNTPAEEFQTTLDVVIAFVAKLQGMPSAPQPDGQCQASFLSIPNLLTALDNDKIRRTADNGAKFMREIGTINWQLPAPPRTDPIWDLICDTPCLEEDLEIGEQISDTLNYMSLTFAMILDDIVASLPPTDASTDRFAQSPWDVTEGLVGEILAGDYVQISAQALELIDALQDVDWDSAIYGLTDEDDPSTSGSVVYALYIMQHISSQLHDGMLSYTPPDSAELPCAGANPWSFPSIPDVLLRNIDAGRIKIALDNGAELFSKLSTIDWKVSTENYPSCSAENAVTCGTPGQLWSNDAAECSSGTFDKWSSSEGCIWEDHDMSMNLGSLPRDCSTEQCCFTPRQRAERECMQVTALDGNARDTCNTRSFTGYTNSDEMLISGTCYWDDSQQQCHSYYPGDAASMMRTSMSIDHPYSSHCKDDPFADPYEQEHTSMDDGPDPDYVDAYCWCAETTPTHYEVINDNMGDLANTQFRDIANFFATVSSSLPTDVSVNDASTELDFVGWLIDALDNERWQVAAGHSSRMSADLDALDLSALYRKFDVEEYSGGIPDDQQGISADGELRFQVVFDVWAALSAKLVAGLAE